MQKTQQDKRGRFARGNKLGKGRPPAATQRERLDALLSVCSAGDWLAVCERAVRDAVRGDRHARQWLTAYLLPAAERVQVEQGPILIETIKFDYFEAVAAIAALPEASDYASGY